MSFPANLGSAGPSPQEVQINQSTQPKKLSFGVTKKNAAVFDLINAPAADSQSKEITSTVKLLNEDSENIKAFENSQVIENVAENTHVFDFNKTETQNIKYSSLKTSEENPKFNSSPKNNVESTLNKVSEASGKIIITKNEIKHSKSEEKSDSLHELNKVKLSKTDSLNFDMLTDEIATGKAVFVRLHSNNTFEIGSSKNYDVIVASNGAIFAAKDKKEKIKNLDKYEALENSPLNKQLKNHFNKNTVFILSTRQSEKINLLIQQLNQKEKKEVVNLTQKNDISFEKIIVQIFKKFKSDEIIIKNKLIILTKLFKAFSKTDTEKDEEAKIKRDIQKKIDQKNEEKIELKKYTTAKIDQNVQQNNKPKN